MKFDKFVEYIKALAKDQGVQIVSVKSSVVANFYGLIRLSPKAKSAFTGEMLRSGPINGITLVGDRDGEFSIRVDNES